MHSVIIPAHPERENMHPVCARLVGRSYESLTPTEASLADHFGMYGEIYHGEWARTRDHLHIRTDDGTPDPDRWIDIRLPPDTPLDEGCWELARVADFWLNSYIPEMLSR